MSAVKILHVDDEPDIREVVELSLGLDPKFTVRSCASGRDALIAAADWSPDLILLDVMMPEMDGPTTLAHLRESSRTSAIPVIFMTARALTREVERFRGLGADSVIPKPFDPLTLASFVRQRMQSPDFLLAVARTRFLERARSDAATLGRDRKALSDGSNTAATLDRIIEVAHKLAGGGGTVGHPEISSSALALEEATIEMRSGAGAVSKVEAALDALVDTIEHA